MWFLDDPNLSQTPIGKQLLKFGMYKNIYK